MPQVPSDTKTGVTFFIFNYFTVHSQYFHAFERNIVFFIG